MKAEISFFLRPRLSDDDEHVGVAGVGDEDLGAVEDPVLPLLVQHGHGLLALGVGAGAGLGQAEGAQPLAGAQLGQVLLLLLLGAVLIDGPHTLLSSSTHMA